MQQEHAPFKEYIVQQVGELCTFHHKWYRYFHDEEEGAREDAILRAVHEFLVSGDGTRGGYERCVLRLQRMQRRMKRLLEEVRGRLRKNGDDEVIDQFDEEYEPHMKILQHAIEILHLKALLMELGA
jgi:hypothetical protein